MEEVPRMPMLSVEVKYSAASTDFGPKISQSISGIYEESPSNYSKEIDEINALRESACKASLDFVGCNVLKKYYAQLHLLKSRFPMESGDQASVTFSWFEKYSDMSNATSVDDVRYEMACVLHNIGAVHSYLGAVDSRLDADGMKISCTHFQRAAYAFHHLNETPAVSHFCSDFDPAVLNWDNNLMMAQAQECILEKSITDHRNPSIIAKIAVQLSNMYKKCLECLEEQSVSEIVEESRSKLWKKFIKIKQKYYLAVAYLHSGVPRDCSDIKQAALAENVGERLAYLQAAKENLSEALKLAVKESPQVKQPLDSLAQIVDHLFTTAKKENDFIYHEKIIAFNDLPEIKGVSLVKLIPFDPMDPEISGPDIFARLLPLSVHQSASLYSEEKAKLLRETRERAEAKDQQLDEYLASLQLEGLNLESRDQDAECKLPEKLLECCAALNAFPDAVPDLLNSMNKLSSLYSEVENVLLDFDQQLDDAENEVKKCEGLAAQEPGIEEAKIRLIDLRKEYKSYLDANKCASKNNTELREALSAHSDNLRILSLPLTEIKKRLPSSAVEDRLEKVELRRIMAKIDEMKAQRKALLDEFRQRLNDDDITKLLLANKDSDKDEIFSKQISKHDEFLKIINQNLAAQENILDALTQANAKYAPIRKSIGDALNKKDEFIDHLIDSYDVYLNLKEKSKQGIEFYDQLQKSLEKFNAEMIEYAHFFNDVEAKFKAVYKNTQKTTTSKTSSHHETDGPKLKDYLAYYQKNRKGTLLAPGQVPASSSISPASITAGQPTSLAMSGVTSNQVFQWSQHPPVYLPHMTSFPAAAPVFSPQYSTGIPQQAAHFPPATISYLTNPTSSFFPPTAARTDNQQQRPYFPASHASHAQQLHSVGPAPNVMHTVQPSMPVPLNLGTFLQYPTVTTYGNFTPSLSQQKQTPYTSPLSGYSAQYSESNLTSYAQPVVAPMQSFPIAHNIMLRPNFMDQPIAVPLPPPMAPLGSSENP